MQETSHKIYDPLFQKHRHLPVVLKQILPSSFLQAPSQAPFCVLIFQQHLSFILPPRRVLIPLARPNLKAFTPSPTSQLSPLYPILCYTLFLQTVFPQPLPCACLLPSLPASSAAPLTYIPRPYPPSLNPHLLLWRMWKSPNYFMTSFPHSFCPATPLRMMGRDSFPMTVSRNVSQDLLAQE